MGECNYVTHGNFDALGNVLLCKKIMAHIGLNPDRLRIEFMSGADGNLLAEFTDDFTSQVNAMGPIGTAEGIDKTDLKFRLDAVKKIIPYIRLVERERMRIPSKSEEMYRHFFSSDEFNRLFDELIVNKLAISQITSLLKEKPLSTGEMARTLGLNPSEISRYINVSSRHGYVRYDESCKCYTLA